MRYAIIIEKDSSSYGVYVPDLPGCVAAAETREEAVRLIREVYGPLEDHIRNWPLGRDTRGLVETVGLGGLSKGFIDNNQ